jgi:hypothetical protein
MTEKKKETKIPVHDKMNEPARYADNAIVYSTKKQFLIDFNQTLPGAEKHITALLTQVAKHEEQYKEGILPPGLELEMITKKREVH